MNLGPGKNGSYVKQYSHVFMHDLYSTLAFSVELLSKEFCGASNKSVSKNIELFQVIFCI